MIMFFSLFLTSFAQRATTRPNRQLGGGRDRDRDRGSGPASPHERIVARQGGGGGGARE